MIVYFSEYDFIQTFSTANGGYSGAVVGGGGGPQDFYLRFDGPTLTPGEPLFFGLIQYDPFAETTSYFEQAASYTGYTVNGDPVVFSGGSYYVLTNAGTIPRSGTALPAAETFCFLEGTRILTPAGEVPVEALRIGDRVLGADGAARPVLWIGRQAKVPPFADPLRDHPVEIAAGALAPGVPARPLRLSPDHALLLDGCLVQAGALVNGTTIRRMARAELGARFTYFHVETEDHALVLAEGAAAETFVDNASRLRFDNAAEYLALYGTERDGMVELPLPRAKSARQVPPATRARIAARAASLATPASRAA